MDSRKELEKKLKSKGERYISLLGLLHEYRQENKEQEKTIEYLSGKLKECFNSKNSAVRVMPLD